MAATNFTPISLYYSTTASAVPTAANLVPGELAINTNDGKLYYEDSSGVVQVLATKSTGSIGGSNTQVQFNNSGSLGGSSSFTWDGTTVTATKFAGALNGTVGATTASTGAFTTLSTSSTTTLSGLTASTALALDASKNVVSVTNTGTGNNVLSASPTLTGTIAGASLSLSSLTSGRVTYAGASGLLQDSANLLYSGTDLTVYGVRVGRGSGAVATNTIVGTTAGNNNSSGNYNTYVGYETGFTNSTGVANTGMGVATLYLNTGSNNTAYGRSALENNGSASNNTAVGYQAGYAITSGTNNSCFGAGAGYGSPVGGTDLTTGQFNILIGAVAYTSGATDSSSIVIGFNTAGKGSSTGFINPNSGGVYQGNNSLSWSITSDQRLKKNIVDNNTGLDKITQIQVRNFEYRIAEEITDLPQEQAIKKEGVQLGVIAQELQQILPECVKTESTGVMSLDTDNLTWYMINAIKQLKAEFDAYKATHP